MTRRSSQDYFLKCTAEILTQSDHLFPDSAEIVILLDGTLFSSSTSAPLSAGTALFLCPDSCFLYTDSSCVFLHLQLDAAFFLDQIPGLTEFPQGQFCIEKHSPLFFHLLDYAYATLSYNCTHNHTKALYYFILDQVPFLYSHAASVLTTGSADGKQVRLMNAILQYTADHLTEESGLSSTAAYFCRTPQYISSLFMKYKNTSFQKYVHTLKQKKAAAYQKYTDLSETEIAERLKMKPSAIPPVHSGEAGNETNRTVRTLLSPDHNTALQLIRKYLKNSPYESDSKLSYNRTAEISVSSGKPVFPVWKTLVNLGYAIDFGHPEILLQLSCMQKKIGYTYGRLCRVFDLIKIYRSEQHVLYDFNRLFGILDILTENHMYPFFELGNKRLRIQLSMIDTLFPDVPQTSEEYFDYILPILPHFITASINRYGYKAVTNWKFEICCPKYESVDMNIDFPLHKYISCFLKIKNCIHKYVPECAIGGPGFNNWISPDAFRNILTFFRSHNFMPDFLTAYLYPVEKTEKTVILSPDPDLCEKRMEQLQSAISEICPDTELWITEFNSNLSSRSYLNDSSYQAAFICHTLFAAVRKKIHAMGYYLMSDTPLRYADSFDMLFGGWGLFSDNSIPKPSFHAMDLFSMLGNKMLYRDSNCMITKTKEGNCQCLFYHYEHIRPEFRDQNIDKDHFFSPLLLFEQTPANSWSLSFPDLKPGYYILNEYSISPTQSNILFLWYQLHFLTPADSDQNELLRQQSAVVPHISCSKITSGTALTLTCRLSKHELKLITVSYFHPIYESEV